MNHHSTNDANQTQKGTSGSRSGLRKFNRFGIYLFLCISALLFVFPILWLVLTSFKTNLEYNATPIVIMPKEWHIENYWAAVTSGRSANPNSTPELIQFGLENYLGALVRSLILIVVSTIPGVLTSAMVGFGFARHRAPGRDLLFKVIIATMLIPSLVIAIPQFVIYSSLHLVGTYWPWFFGALGTNTFGIFLFRQYFSSMPKDLEDAAEIDGCGRLRIFWSIFLPNAKPLIAVLTIFSFQGNWGDFFSPALFLKATQPTMATVLQSNYTDPMNNPLMVETMAAVTLFILPPLIIYLMGQKHIQKSVLTSGLK